MTGSGAAVVDRRATLIVTRPKQDADGLIDALRARGRSVVAYPVIAIEAVDDAATLASTMARLADYRLVVFVSPNAIRQALAKRSGPWPPDVAIGVMGPGSVETLRRLGIEAPVRVVSPARSGTADPADDRFDSEALFTALDAAIGLGDRFHGRVLLVRGNGGRGWFADRLRGLGIVVDEVEAYRRVRPEPDAAASAAIDALFRSRASAVFIVTSSEGIDNLSTMVERSLVGAGADPPTVRSWLLQTPLLAPHLRIADRARKAGFQTVSVCAPGDRGILATIE